MSDEVEVSKAVRSAHVVIELLKELRERKGHLWAAMVEFMLEVKVINGGMKINHADALGKVSSKFVIAMLHDKFKPEQISDKLDELMADTDALVDQLVEGIK